MVRVARGAGKVERAGRWGALLALALASSAAAAPLVVSITIDDGYADATVAASLLEARGLRATFFIISGYLNRTGYLTSAQVRALEATGHEIGGHTVSHRHLVTLPADDLARELCNDRAALVAYGLHPQSFAYPFGELNAAVRQAVIACGYGSARTVGPITDFDAPAAESIPPVDPFAIITPWSVESTMPLSELQGWVTAAEAVGGWLPIVFHHVCQPGVTCDQYGITTTDLGAFLDWLQARAPLGTTIKLQREVVGGAPLPLVSLANPVMNPSLEGATGTAVPVGWQRGGSGTNTPVWSTVSTAHSGTSAQRLDVTSYTSGSNQLVPSQTNYAPPAFPGHLYRLSAWYTSSVAPRWTAYYRDQQGAWFWWTQSASVAASPSGWTQATWTTPALPSGATGLSFGLSLASTGSLTVDDLAMADQGLAPTTVALTSPVSGASVNGVVPLTASATSPSGVSRVDFFAAGQPVGSASAAPYTVTWNSASVGDGAQVLSASVLDGAGATVASPPVTVAVTNAAGLVKNPSLESDVAPADGVPDCWQRSGFGTFTASWATTSDAHAGVSAQRVDVTSYTTGALRLVPTQDTGACAPPGVPGHTYRITGWYKASGGQPRWVAYYRSSTGVWTWWAQSALLPTSATWAQSTFVTPALPAGATHVSFGLSLYSTGSLTVDDFTLFDLTGP